LIYDLHAFDVAITLGIVSLSKSLTAHYLIFSSFVNFSDIITIQVAIMVVLWGLMHWLKHLRATSH